MAWSIAQVARMSKVTSRTLRHYDDIGLLPPAFLGGNGYRYYEQEQLLRLQQILVMRELGVGLESIKEIVHDGRDQREVLRMHHDWLLAERDRFQRLADTVSRTIQDLEGGDKVSKKSMAHWFEGFDDPAKQEALQEEARKRWGAEAVDAANAAVKDQPKEYWADKMRDWADQVTALVELIDTGHAPGDEPVQAAIANHYQWLSGQWQPNRETYIGLGNVYCDEPRFRENFDKTDPRLAEFLRDAMTVYAERNLA
jgi:DNA-binding transcriptional MerR regulator